MGQTCVHAPEVCRGHAVDETIVGEWDEHGTETIAQKHKAPRDRSNRSCTLCALLTGPGDSEPFLVKHAMDSANLTDSLVDINSVTTLCVKQKLLSLSGDSFKIKKGDGSRFLEVQGNFMTLRSQMVLQYSPDRPIAVVLRKVMSWERSCYVYSLTPRVQGQRASSETLNGRPLYSWARVNRDMLPIRGSYTMYMAIGHDTFDNGSYHGEAPGVCSPALFISKNGEPACNIDRGFFQFESANCYSLDIAPGIDPALMICFAVIKDELEESR